MTIEQLENCRSAKGEIESLRERMERIKSDRERMTQAITWMKQSKGQLKNLLEELTTKLIEKSEQIADKLWQRETEIKEVEAWIETLKPHQQDVVRMRYIEGRKWRQIARKLNYTKDGAIKINKAVKEKIEK